MNLSHSHFSSARRAFSLIEVIIATALMSIIVLGLLIMFGQTQRAFRTGVTQTDVMESGRAALDLVAREVEQAAATGLPNTINFQVAWANNNTYSEQDLPGGGERTNLTQNTFFTVRSGQQWRGVGYAVITNAESIFIGTLYRFEAGASALRPDAIYDMLSRAGNSRSNRVIDNVVHLRFLAYDNFGRLITERSYSSLTTASNFNPSIFVVENVNLPGDLGNTYTFVSNAIPAHVEIELGILEAKVADRLRGIPMIDGVPRSSQPQWRYLDEQAARVQLFRQRVPLRNADVNAFQFR